MPTSQDVCLISIDGGPWEDAMVEIIEILREEHRNIEKLLRVMEQELSRLRSRRTPGLRGVWRNYRIL